MKYVKAAKQFQFVLFRLMPLFMALLILPVQLANAAIGGDCNPVAIETCGLPFPSDLFRDSTTGKLDFPDAILDRRVGSFKRIGAVTLKAQFPDKFSPTAVFNGSSGFSPLGPVLFELPAWPKDEIPADGNGVLRVFDLATGADIPMVVSLSRVANAKRDLRHPDKSPVIIAWPQTRFEFGKQYVAVLMKNLYDANYRLMQPTGKMKTALGFYLVVPKSSADQLKTAYKPIVSFLSGKGIDKAQVLSATYFTVKSEAEVTKPLFDMVETAKETTPVLSNIKVHDEIGSKVYGAGTLQGAIQLVNFRSSDGGVYPPYRPIANEQLSKSDFVLTLPKWDQSGPVPIAIWGHGMANEKSVTKTAFIRNDNMGVATFAIDHPNHGSRISENSPFLGTLVNNPKNMMQLLGMYVQAVVDQSSVIHAATDAIPEAISKVAGAPTLDGSRFVYHGLSMGAMVGAAVGAVNTELKGAYLTNGSGALVQIFSESLFWEPSGSAIIPMNVSGAEETFVLAMMQHYLDIADGMNFAHYYRNPPAGTVPVRLAMQYSIKDGNVPNSASIGMAEVAKLPLLKSDAFVAVPQLPFGMTGIDSYEDKGFGILQTSYGLDSVEQTIDEVKQFDSSYFAGINTSALADLLDKADQLGIDVSKFSSITALVAATGNLFSATTGDSLNTLIDTLYQGDVASFLTHFNTTPLYANISNINWYCDLLSLDSARCDAAKKIEEEKAKSGNILDPGTGNETDTDTDTEIPTEEEITDGINKAIDDGKAALNDLKVSVNQGSGGAMSLPESSLVALLLLMRVRMQRIRKLIMGMVKNPFVRVIGAALWAGVFWGGWAYIANGVNASHTDFQSRAIKAGIGQACTSFVMTVIGSLLLEFLFVKLFYSRHRNVLSVLIVTSLSLAAMICVHILSGTPRIFITIAPIYAVVVFYCSAYVKTLSLLNNSASLPKRVLN